MTAAVQARTGHGAGGFGAPALIAVAHGSRDPRSAATMAAVTAQLAAARPDLDVRLAFLDLNAPSVDQVIDAVAAQGHTRAIVVPLLLGSAFHARVDLPGLLASASARHPRLELTQADVLGADPRLVSALRDRVIAADRAAGRMADRTIAYGTVSDHSGGSRRAGLLPDSRLGVAVAAVGSSSDAANARTAEVARMLAAATGWTTEICFATTGPSVAEAAARLRARGAERVLVAPWFLAPGQLTDRLADQAPELEHAEVLGPHPALTDVVLDRYDAAAHETLLRSA
ncbi:sirohydrochlorin chelatase [Nocardia cyriacigeorgica]|uniref:sirohydrochlorin chelatase n=1 Tax=Nocardia cyriacigeorgica TaxID=135487 RepID=UPI00249201C4|nr:sirohydrochlorin chelatase [Nocardia cyriacigeorgica]BDT85851.1 sirohydrochlorin chelatase [Nocardia cyriacigeorgica]